MEEEQRNTSLKTDTCISFKSATPFGRPVDTNLEIHSFSNTVSSLNVDYYTKQKQNTT